MPESSTMTPAQTVARGALRLVVFGMPAAGKSSLLGALAQAAKTQEQLGQAAEIMPDTFHGKNILQAAEAYLEMVGRPARSTEEIAEALGKGGVSATAPSVATILGRSKGSGVQRVKRGLWGLAEWYGQQG